jgi:hypothetical protein
MAPPEKKSEQLFSWLLDPEAPGVRYLALRDVLELPEDDPELAKARSAAHREGPIAAVLDKMSDAGFWGEPGPGYNPKYFSTVWSIILLAQLGGSVREDERIHRACAYLLAHNLTASGQFTTTGAPSGTVDCLQGNLCWALMELDFDDPRLEKACEWMARTVTAEGVGPLEEKQAPVRYYAGKCGPVFACGANNKLSCAWGGTKVMLALGKLPRQRRTPLIESAIQQGVDFFFSTNPIKADYPSGWSDKPSGNWWKFGFPVFYITDILQIVEALVSLGYGKDPRLAEALELVRSKQDTQGRWALEFDYNGKTWVDFGAKKQPNKWVTLRALRVLRGAESYS